MGGHNVPSATIQRRFAGGIHNFFNLYQPLADSWRVYDNSEVLPHLIAHGRGGKVESIADAPAWSRLKEHNHER
jgi:predicted ABC-type ATPase